MLATAANPPIAAIETIHIILSPNLDLPSNLSTRTFVAVSDACNSEVGCLESNCSSCRSAFALSRLPDLWSTLILRTSVVSLASASAKNSIGLSLSRRRRRTISRSSSPGSRSSISIGDVTSIGSSIATTRGREPARILNLSVSSSSCLTSAPRDRRPVAIPQRSQKCFYLPTGKLCVGTAEHRPVHDGSGISA